MKEIVNFNSQQENYTPLQIAVLQNRSDEIIRLLSQNVPLNAKYQFSLTALHFAALIKSVESLQLLIVAGADINAPNSSGRPLCISVLAMVLLRD